MKNINRTPFYLLCVAIFIIVSSSALAAPPANDNFRNAETIGEFNPISLGFQVSNADATSEPGEPNGSGAAAGKSIWYRWTSTEDPRPTQITLHNNTIATRIAVYRGTQLNNLILVVADQRALGDGKRSQVVFRPLPNTTYYIQLDGQAGSQVQTGLMSVVLSPVVTRTSNDFDGDGRSDIGVFRPSDGTFYTYGSALGNLIARRWGMEGDVPVTGDFGMAMTISKSDFTVWRPSVGTLFHLPDQPGSPYSEYNWGEVGGIVVAGNFIGDGATDVAYYHPGTSWWYITPTAIGPTASVVYGESGDLPVAGDWDMDSRTDIAVFRPSNGTWYIRSSQYGERSVHWGSPGDLPVRGDFDGDGINDLAVYRRSEGNWYVRRSSNGSYFVRRFGIQEDRPVSGDFDGDGRFDIALYRPSTSTWYILNSYNGAVTFQKWGISGDIPLAVNPVG